MKTQNEEYKKLIEQIKKDKLDLKEQNEYENLINQFSKVNSDLKTQNSEYKNKIVQINKENSEQITTKKLIFMLLVLSCFLS